jgi:hypothetical protein
MRRTLPAVLAVLIMTACGCIMGNGRDEADGEPSPPAPPAPNAADAKTDGGRVAVEWQQKLVDRLKGDAKATLAYGVFSEGGWADAGQVMIVTAAGGAGAQLVVVDPNKKEPAVDRPLTAAEWQALAPQLDGAAALADVDVQGFDHQIFEYVALKREADGRVVVADRLYVSNPGSKKFPAQDALIAAFQALRTAPRL